MNTYKKREKLSSQQDKQIMQDYNSGMKKSVIQRKHKITDWQLLSIIKREINKNVYKKEKVVMSHREKPQTVDNKNKTQKMSTLTTEQDKQ